MPEKKVGCCSSVFGAIAIVAVVGAIVYVVKNPGGFQPQPQAPPVVAAPQAKASDELQAERKKLIESLVSRGVFKKIETPASHPHLWVTPAYLALDFDQKTTFANLVFGWAYELPKDATNIDRDFMLVLRHSKTDKRIGVFTPAIGLSLDE